MDLKIAPKVAPNRGRVERKMEETRQKIIKTAMELFMRQGVGATTMEQIAGEVDIAKGTLYNYFPVKEAIISEYIRQAFGEKSGHRKMELHAAADTRARLVMILNELIEGILNYPEIFEKFLVYRMQNIISLHKSESEKSGVENLGKEIIKLGQDSGEIRTDLPSSILEDLFEFIFIEIVKQSADRETFKAQEAIVQGVDLFMRAAEK